MVENDLDNSSVSFCICLHLYVCSLDVETNRIGSLKISLKLLKHILTEETIKRAEKKDNKQ